MGLLKVDPGFSHSIVVLQSSTASVGLAKTVRWCCFFFFFRKFLHVFRCIKMFLAGQMPIS